MVWLAIIYFICCIVALIFSVGIGPRGLFFQHICFMIAWPLILSLIVVVYFLTPKKEN